MISLLAQNEIVLQHVPDGSFVFVGVLAPDGTLLEVNQAAFAAVSVQPASVVVGKPLENTAWWDGNLKAQAQLHKAIEAAALGRSVRYDTDVRMGERRGTLELTLLPVFDETGNVRHVIASGVEIGQRSLDRIQRLQHLTAALSKSVTPQQVAEVILRESMATLGAVRGAIHTLTDGGESLEILSSLGYDEDAVASYGGLPLTAPVPGAHVVQTGQPIWFNSYSDLAAQYPSLPAGADSLGQRGGAIVPLVAEDRIIGALVLIFDSSHPLQMSDRDFVLAVANLCAQALERARIFEAEQRARAAADSAGAIYAFMAETSRALSVSLDFDSQLHRIAQLALPLLADMSIVVLFELDGSGSMVKVAHVQPEKAEWLAEQAKNARRMDTESASPMLEVLRTGQSLFFPQLSTEQFEVFTRGDASARRFWQESGVKSMIVVPLAASGRVFGAVILAMAESGRHYSEEVRAVAEEWARRVALPVDNARLHQRLQVMNTDLEQRVVQRTLDLNASRNQLRSLAARLQAAREEERQRMAREVHDVIGQLLTSIKMDISSLGRELSEQNSPSVTKIDDITGLLDSTIKSVRKVATELRPSILDDMGVVAAVEWQVHEFAERSGIACDFVCAPDEIPMSNEKATAIFRLIQEALTNVARHSEATQLQVELHETAGVLSVEVRDNGRGITDQELKGATSLGLLGMHERVHLLAGELAIWGAPGKGTTVSAQIPLAKSAR